MISDSLPFEKYVFVCVNERKTGISCGPRGGEEIREKLKQGVKELGLQGRVRVSRAGCLDRCSEGPNVMIFPDNVWYHHVKPEDVQELLKTIDARCNPA